MVPCRLGARDGSGAATCRDRLPSPLWPSRSRTTRSLGDTGTAALVGRDGSIDWLCLPRFDSRGLLRRAAGDARAWSLAASGRPTSCTSTRQYVGNSFVLETTHATETGVVKVTDLMPLARRTRRRRPHRRGSRGHGADAARVDRPVRLRQGAALGDPPQRRGRPRGHLRRRRARHARPARHPAAQRPPTASMSTSSTSTRATVLTFSTTWLPSYHPIPAMLDVDERLSETVVGREDWAQHVHLRRPVPRSTSCARCWCFAF